MPGIRIPISLLILTTMLFAMAATMSALHSSQCILTIETTMHTNKVTTDTQRGSGPGNAGGHNNSDTTIAIVITSVVPTARRTAVATTATNAIPIDTAKLLCTNSSRLWSLEDTTGSIHVTRSMPQCAQAASLQA